MRGSFIVDTSIDADTVIYINTEYYYPNGFNIVFSDGHKIFKQKFSFDGAHISFKITEE
jgi:prepilin-type processing-associated H-X9-DG protein